MTDTVQALLEAAAALEGEAKLLRQLAKIMPSLQQQEDTRNAAMAYLAAHKQHRSGFSSYKPDAESNWLGK